MNYPDWFIIIFLIAFGATLGSFMNVCIYRIPKHLSIVKPRSFCPACGSLIPWYQNIPVLSYFLLLGNCASCGARISPVYPFVEIVAAVATVSLYLEFGLAIEFIAYLPFTLALIVLFFIDYREKLLPDEITISGIILGIGLSPLLKHLGILNSILGAATGFVGFYLIAFIYERLTGKEGMGGGDIKMITMVGAFLGLKGVLATIFIASLTGAIVGLLLIIFFRKSFKHALPFGCFISIGSLIFLFAGERLLNCYLSLIGLA
ncbi:MAG: prepilin peptidase [Acidobacteriota bacterium]